jgi:hypothetical protein
MKMFLQIGTSLAALAIVAAAIELLPSVLGGMVRMALAGTLMILGLVFGQKLPLTIRVFATSLFFYYGYSMCLLGRTMEPGINAHTFGAALGMSIFGLLPALSLVRVWRPALGISLIAILLPLSLGAAFIAAGIEEHLFVRKYRETGVGPTARWTVAHHWLSYNRERQKLYGSD